MPKTKEVKERDIITILKKLGVPTQLVANHYLRKAIDISLQNEKYLTRIKEDVYFVVAMHFYVLPKKVEHLIENAVSSAKSKVLDNELWEELFGVTQPTDIQFITQVVKKLKGEI